MSFKDIVVTLAALFVIFERIARWVKNANEEIESEEESADETEVEETEDEESAEETEVEETEDEESADETEDEEISINNNSDEYEESEHTNMFSVDDSDEDVDNKVEEAEEETFEELPTQNPRSMKTIEIEQLRLQQ